MNSVWMILGFVCQKVSNLSIAGRSGIGSPVAPQVNRCAIVSRTAIPPRPRPAGKMLVSTLHAFLARWPK